jgi:hypothetical protein
MGIISNEVTLYCIDLRTTEKRTVTILYDEFNGSKEELIRVFVVELNKKGHFYRRNNTVYFMNETK